MSSKRPARCGAIASRSSVGPSPRICALTEVTLKWLEEIEQPHRERALGDDRLASVSLASALPSSAARG